MLIPLKQYVSSNISTELSLVKNRCLKASYHLHKFVPLLKCLLRFPRLQYSWLFFLRLPDSETEIFRSSITFLNPLYFHQTSYVWWHTFHFVDFIWWDFQFLEYYSLPHDIFDVFISCSGFGVLLSWYLTGQQHLSLPSQTELRNEPSPLLVSVDQHKKRRENISRQVWLTLKEHRFLPFDKSPVCVLFAQNTTSKLKKHN